MWKLEVLRDGAKPEVHEGVTLAYENHPEGAAMPGSEMLVVYNSLSERIRGLRSHGVIGGRLLPEFDDNGFRVKGTGGTLTDAKAPFHPFREYVRFTAEEPQGKEVWELTVLPSAK